MYMYDGSRDHASGSGPSSHWHGRVEASLRLTRRPCSLWLQVILTTALTFKFNFKIATTKLLVSASTPCYNLTMTITTRTRWLLRSLAIMA
jgi:hypothetical protein